MTLHQHSCWHVNEILYWLKKQTHANAGGEAYETPRRGRIKSATKTKSECERFSLMLHKRRRGALALSWVWRDEAVILFLCELIVIVGLPAIFVFV